jgi:hypothetical protein
LQIGAAYTFSKALGAPTGSAFLSSSNGASTLGGTSLNPYFDYRHFDYGPLSIDRSQSLVFNYIYEIPGVGTHYGFRPAGWILAHWSVSGITTFQTGAPFTPTFTTTNGANITGSAIGPSITVVGNPRIDNPTFQENFNTAAFAPTPVGSFGNAGPGILRGPGINNWDLSLTKARAARVRIAPAAIARRSVQCVEPHAIRDYKHGGDLHACRSTNESELWRF